MAQSRRRFLSITNIVRLRTEGQIFWQGDNPFKYKGLTFFKGLDNFVNGKDISSFLSLFQATRYNVVRTFLYTPEADWGANHWNIPDRNEDILNFILLCASSGFYVELVLKTADSPELTGRIKEIVNYLASKNLDNLLLEIGNEPKVHKNIDTRELKGVCDASGYLYSSGEYDSWKDHFGHYLTDHSPRDSEWPRKAKVAVEFYNGGDGPDYPALRIPVVEDEPIRPDQAGYNTLDYYTYGAILSACAAGGTFHYLEGEFGNLPNEQALDCAIALSEGLDIFPLDSPLHAPYSKIVEDDVTLRTYIFGDNLIRVRPKVVVHQVGEFKSLDDYGIAFRR